MAGGRRSVIAGYARREQASLTVRVVTAVLEGGDVMMRGGRDGQDGRDEGLAAAEVGVVTPYSAQAALLRELLQVP